MPIFRHTALPKPARRAAAIVVSFGIAILLASATLTAVHPEGDTSIGRLLRLVSVDDEANLWAWYSSALWILAAVGFAVLATCQASLGGRRTYWIFAGIAVYLSADETVALHEQLSWRLPFLQTVMGAWLIVAVPFVVAIGIALLLIARQIPPVLRRRLVVAGAVYLAGAAGAEAVGGVLTVLSGLTTDSPLYVVESHVEEALELLGTLLALRAVGLQLVREAPLRALVRPVVRRTDETISGPEPIEAVDDPSLPPRSPAG